MLLPGKRDLQKSSEPTFIFLTCCYAITFNMKRYTLIVILIMVTSNINAQSAVRVAVAGLTHGHVDWIFNADDNDIELVGIYEPNTQLAKRYANRYQLDEELFFTDLEEMLDRVKPEAVSAFGAVSEHVEVVRACAPRKIHVMVEKPLAFSIPDAREIESLAKKYSIHVLTNFETSWYVSNREVKEMVDQGKLGVIRKVMVNAGHQGPKEIGVSPEFLEILTNPGKNGAGALVDFGCYGASLMTWLMNGEKPISVTAVVNQNKPEIYTSVDDDATIVLQYPGAQCIVQGSWSWTFSRKDMEVYGTSGYAIAEDPVTIRQGTNDNASEEIFHLNPKKQPYQDPFAYLASVVRGSIQMDENDLYGLPINLTVVEILDAAIRSAEEGRTIFME